MTRSSIIRFDTEESRQKWLDHFTRTGSITEACAIIGITRGRYYEVLKEDPYFAAAVEDAKAALADTLEVEAIRRARDGVTHTTDIYHNGVVVGVQTEVKYSDGLLKFLLAGLRPEVYRDSANRRLSGTVEIVKSYSDVDLEAV